MRVYSDTVNMVNAPWLARERGLDVREIRHDRERDYHTLLTVSVATPEGPRTVAGTLFGNAAPRLVDMFGIAIEAELAGEMIYIVNEDAPGFIGRLGTIARRGRGQHRHLPSRPARGGRRGGRSGLGRRPYRFGTGWAARGFTRGEEGEAAALLTKGEGSPFARSSSPPCSRPRTRRSGGRAASPNGGPRPRRRLLLRPFAYEPRTIRLEAGRPVQLQFVNNSRSTLSVSAPAFFRAARLRGREARRLAGGGFRLAPGERLTVALVPAPGRYRARSTNLLHRTLGMSAEILVE